MICLPSAGKLTQALKDSQLGPWLEDTPESVCALLNADLAGVFDATQARSMHGWVNFHCIKGTWEYQHCFLLHNGRLGSLV